jgi:ADP-ribose pyrophosphatase
VRDGDGVVSIEPWRVLSSRISYEDRWLKVRSDDCVTADGRHISPYHVLEYPDCINVVALTPEGQLLLVREYRHGCGEIMLGLVSGAHEAADGESADAAERAARRELREETGYSGGRFTPILTSYPNPANQNNKVTTFLAMDVVLSGEQQLDANEAIEVRLDDLATILVGLRRGETRMQAMHVAALWSAAAQIMAGEPEPEDTATLRAKLLAAFS